VGWVFFVTASSASKAFAILVYATNYAPKNENFKTFLLAIQIQRPQPGSPGSAASTFQLE
jgi:hypothetical protein